MACVLSLWLTVAKWINAVVGLGSAWIGRLGLLVIAPMNGFAGFKHFFLNGFCWVQTYFLNGFAGDGFDGFDKGLNWSSDGSDGFDSDFF